MVTIHQPKNSKVQDTQRPHPNASIKLETHPPSNVLDADDGGGEEEEEGHGRGELPLCQRKLKIEPYIQWFLDH